MNNIFILKLLTYLINHNFASCFILTALCMLHLVYVTVCYNIL